ncbi:MAG: Nif3-like dinuclear metal center hexameric protein [Clostridia bacterium]|nr:Nif3-like dinuclear metal center hexameric protein [Clostridia bacterium]
MKTCTVADVLSLVNEIAPFDLAEEWDNVGLLQGYRGAEVRHILVALDITEDVVREAITKDCQCIVTHHPFMFRPIQRVTDETREGRIMLELARSGIAHIAAHTNLDAAPGGVNDTLLTCIGAVNIRGEGCLRAGDLEPVSFGSLCRHIASVLNAEVRTYGDPDRLCHVIGCCSGAGSDEYRDAMQLGADCFLTGEVRHNVALDALDDGCLMIEAGHYETERVICPVLAETLQKRLDELEYGVKVTCFDHNLVGRKE